MRLFLAAVLSILLTACTFTPRDWGESACEFIFLAGLTHVLPTTPSGYAGICSFGVRTLRSEPEDDEECEDEECDDEGEEDDA